jgi:hypothetical protein
MKASKRIRCKNCTKQFTASRLTAKNCSSSCRKSWQRKVAKTASHICIGHLNTPCPDKKATKAERCRSCKRVNGRMISFFNTSFGARLANELRKRAGSVELLDGMSGLLKYFEMHKLLSKANPVNGSKVEINYHIAHRVAVREYGGRRRGMYSEGNLVAVPAKQNQSFGNKDVFIAAEPDVHFRWVSSLNEDLFVDESTSHSELRLLLISHLGSEFIDWVDKMNLPRRAKKVGSFSSEGLSPLAVATVQSEPSLLTGLSIDKLRDEPLKGVSLEDSDLVMAGYKDVLSPDERAHELHHLKLTGLEFWVDGFDVENTQGCESIKPEPKSTPDDDW